MQVGAGIQMCCINILLYELAQIRFFNLFFLWDFFSWAGRGCSEYENCKLCS